MLSQVFNLKIMALSCPVGEHITAIFHSANTAAGSDSPRREIGKSYGELARVATSFNHGHVPFPRQADTLFNGIFQSVWAA